VRVAVVRRSSGALYAIFANDDAWPHLVHAVKSRRGVLTRWSTLERYGYPVPLIEILRRRPAVARPYLLFESVDAFAEWVRRKASELLKTERARRRAEERLREELERARRSLAGRKFEGAKRYRALKYTAFSGVVPASYDFALRKGRVVGEGDVRGVRYELVEYKRSVLIHADAYHREFLFVRKGAEARDAVEELLAMSERGRQRAGWLLRLGAGLAKRAGRRDIADHLAALSAAAMLLL